MDKLDKVTRFEVIDHRSSMAAPRRVFTAYGVSVGTSVQDGGRTLKIFVTDNPDHKAEEVHQQVRDGLGAFALGDVEELLETMNSGAREAREAAMGTPGTPRPGSDAGQPESKPT